VDWGLGRHVPTESPTRPAERTLRQIVERWTPYWRASSLIETPAAWAVRKRPPGSQSTRLRCGTRPPPDLKLRPQRTDDRAVAAPRLPAPTSGISNGGCRSRATSGYKRPRLDNGLSSVLTIGAGQRPGIAGAQLSDGVRLQCHRDGYNRVAASVDPGLATAACLRGGTRGDDRKTAVE
jgi:hypothetical protein